MLNGIAPLIIFSFKKLLNFEIDLSTGSQPVVAGQDTYTIPLVPIPVYLDEKLTGIIVTSQNKNIDIRTEAETLSDGDTPKANQKGLNSSITVTMVSSSESIGLNVLLALIDQIFEKVTSQEYSISYINKAVTVFNGLLDSFSVQEDESSNKITMTMVISKVTGSSTVEKVAPTVLPKLGNAAVLGGG